MRARPSCSVLFLILPALVLLRTTGAGPVEGVYRPPVDAPIVDPFRPPAGPYGPGNRGLDYATVPGTPVDAIGAGVVVFAGQVAGQLFVTVLHPDGLRSSLSFLATISVVVGQAVRLGQPVGTAGPHLQLGVRRGDVYLDPARLFRHRGRPHLVRPGR